MLVGFDMNLNSCQFNPGLLHCIIKHSKSVFGQENRMLYICSISKCVIFKGLLFPSELTGCNIATHVDILVIGDVPVNNL